MRCTAAAREEQNDGEGAGGDPAAQDQCAALPRQEGDKAAQPAENGGAGTTMERVVVLARADDEHTAGDIDLEAARAQMDIAIKLMYRTSTYRRATARRQKAWTTR